MSLQSDQQVSEMTANSTGTTEATSTTVAAALPRPADLSWRERVRPYCSFLVVLTFLVLALVFIFSRGKVADPDIWWHLHNAEYLMQHHAFPRQDTFSFTVAGYPWMNHEWLAELPYYFAWRAMGLRGIEWLTFVVLCAIFLGILYLSYRECGHYKAAVAACCCAVFLALHSFGPRTILFGYALMVVLLIILQRFEQKGHAPLWLIPLLFGAWVNTHGSWFIGLIMFSAVVAAGFVPLKWGLVESEPWTAGQKKRVLLTWLASIAMLFVNPFGARLVLYPLDMAFRQKMNIEHVEEWVSINFHDPRGKFVLLVLLMLLISALVRPRRWRLAELALVLFAVYSGLTYIRFLFLMGIVITPTLAKALDFLPEYRPEDDTPLVNVFAMLLIVAGVVYYWPGETRLRASVNDQYPTEALVYLHDYAPPGPTLNYYLWGGYINWRDRDLKVFVDGRGDIFDYSGVLKDYLDLISVKDVDALLGKYKIQYVLFPHGEPLTYVLEHDQKWKEVYSDRVSVVLRRAEGEPADDAHPRP